MTKSVGDFSDHTCVTPTCYVHHLQVTSINYTHVSGSRLPIWYSHTELQLTLVQSVKFVRCCWVCSTCVHSTFDSNSDSLENWPVMSPKSFALCSSQLVYWSSSQLNVTHTAAIYRMGTSVVHGYINICSHFFNFCPDDDWSIQSKCQQVLFRT